MNISEFSEANRRRSEAPNGFCHPLDSWSISDWFTAVMGELGEAANIAKKLNRVRDGIIGNEETPEELQAKLAQELADTFIYLDLLAQRAGIDLESAVVATFNTKSSKIGYSEFLMTPTLQSKNPCTICGGRGSIENEDGVWLCSCQSRPKRLK